MLRLIGVVMRWLIVFAALAIVAAPALAQQTCNAPGTAGTPVEMVWTATGSTSGGAWSGCTPTADDTFIVSAGDTVRAICSSGAITLTTGKLVVDDGGRFIVEPGCYGTAPFTQSGDTEITDGGIYEATGEVIATGRVAAEVTSFAANATTIVVDFDTAGIVADQDYVRFTYDDWPDPGATVTNLHLGSGPPLPGVHRVGYESGVWYRISAVSGNTITYDVDEWLADAQVYVDDGVDLPYVGTRDHIATTPITPTSYERGPLGLTTLVNIAAGTLTANMDATDQYVVYPLAAVRCPGWHAKILNSVDDVGGDQVRVIGDLTNCDGDIRIHRGVRWGDPLEIVRPPVIAGAGTGSITVLGDGILRLSRARLHNMGARLLSTFTPVIHAHGMVIFAESADDDEPDWTQSYIEKVDVGWMELNGNANGGIVIAANQDIYGNDPRFSDRAIDVTGLRLEEIYSHDTVDETGGLNGHHSFYITGASNAKLIRPRCARVNDDCVAATQTTYPATTGAPFLVQQAIAMGLMAGDQNSQECIQLIAPYYGDGADHGAVIQNGKHTVEDSILTGCEAGTIDLAAGGKWHRNVIGGTRGIGNIQQIGIFWVDTFGANWMCGGSGDPAPECTAGPAGSGTGTGLPPDFAAYDFPADVSDSFWTIEPTLNGNLSWGVSARVTRSIMQSGYNLAAVQDNAIQGVVGSTESVFIAQNPASLVTFRYDDETTGSGGLNNSGRRRELTATDTAFVFMNVGAGDWLQQFYDSADTLNPSALTLRRFFLMLNQNTAWGNGILALNSAVELTAERGYFTNTDAPINAHFNYGGQAAGSVVSNSCGVTLRITESDTFKTASDGSNRPLLRGIATPKSIGDILASSDPDAPSNARCGPEKLGWGKIGPAHMMAGDAVVNQLDRFGSELRVNLGGGGGGTRGPWPGGPWP